MDIELSSSIVHSSSTTGPRVRPFLVSVRSTASLPLADEVSFVQRLQLISEREGEDAQLTGGTRSLHRRLLALNIYEGKRASVREVEVSGTDTRIA